MSPLTSKCPLKSKFRRTCVPKMKNQRGKPESGTIIIFRHYIQGGKMFPITLITINQAFKWANIVNVLKF